MNNQEVNKVIERVKKLTNIDLTLCDYFTEVKEWINGTKYFNVIAKDNREANYIYSLVHKVKEIKEIQPNGIDRLAIVFKY